MFEFTKQWLYTPYHYKIHMKTKKTMSVTVRDLAKLAGVSVGTVSRALKNQTGLSEKTRKHILAIAAELGYDYDKLQVEPIKRIAFILHRQHNTLTANPFFSAVLQGAENACREMDVSLSFLAVGPADPVIAQLAKHEVDAMLCVGFFEPEMLQLLKQTGKPLVLVDQWAVDSVCINPDNETGGYLATKHLLDTGRKRIAFLASSLAHYSIRQRERGYRRALFEAQVLISPDLDVIVPPGMNVESGIIYSIRQLLECPVRPDAIFVYNDAAALIAMRVCQEMGFSVPDDIAIVGFDDIKMASLCNPALTTLAVDKYKLGHRGIELLAQRVAQSEEILPVELIVRSSSS